ncbi:tape measure protein [Brevibacterium aurantiacum]|uniref:tape measure protein n=1 Tax=Brevibacterium aurantiacum TaxID=273384 RepID=UPI003F90C0DA
MPSIASAYINVAPTFPGFQKAAAKESGALEKTFGASGKRTGGAFSRTLGKVVKGGVVATATVTAAGLGYALTKGFERLSQIEDASASLAGLGHSANDVKSIMNDALASVKGTSFGMGEAAQVAAAAVASGVKPGAELQRTLKLTADAATIGGSSMSEMGLIFNKVASSNKMQADTANMLLQRGIPIWQLLSKTMNMSVEDVQKLSKQGKIGFADFQKAMEEGLGGAALEVGNTTSGALKNIGAAAGRLGAVLLGGVFPKIKPLFVSIIGVIDRLTDAAEPLGNAIGKILGPAIAGLSKWLDGLDFTKVSTGSGAMSWMASVGTTLKNAVAPLAPVFSFLGDALAWMGQHLGLVVKALPILIGLFAAYRMAMNVAAAATFSMRAAELSMAPVYLANNILRFAAIRADHQLTLAKSGAAVAEARETAALGTNSAALGTNAATTKSASLATKWHDTVTKLTTRSMIAGKLATIGSTISLVAHKAALVATSVATRAAAVAQRLFNLALKASPIILIVGAIAGIAFALQQFFTKTEEGRIIWAKFQTDIMTALLPLKAEFVKLQPVFAQLMGTLSGALASVMPVVATVVTTLVTGLVPVISNLAQTLFPILAQVIGVVVQVIGSILQAVLPVVAVLLQALVPVISLVLTVIAKIVQVLAAILVPVIQVLGAVITWLVGAITTGVTAAGGVMSTVFGGIATFFQTVLGPAFSWLYNVIILPVFRGIQLAVQIWWAVVSTIFNAVISFVRAVFAPIFTFFKTVATIAFQVVRTAVQIWWAIVKIVFQAVVAFVRAVFAPVFTFFKTVATVAFTLVRLAIAVWWTGVKLIFAAVVSFVRTVLAPAFTWFYKNVIVPVWNGIKTAINFVWSFIKTYIFNPIVAFVRDQLQPRFQLLKATVQTVWAAIKSKIHEVWTSIKSKVFDPLANVVKNTLPKAFEAGRDAIGKAWDKLRALARKPVAFVIETIIRDGLVKPFNKVAGVFGADKIDEKLFTVPKLWTGGPVPGHSPTATADNIPIWATAGEFMVRRRSADRLRRRQPGLLEHINRHGEVPGYKSGGDIVALGHALQGIGVRVSEHPKFGGVHPVHAKNSWHYRAGALDLNTAPGQSKGEMAFFDKLMPILQGLGWGTIWRYPNHFGHAHVDMGGRKLGNFKSGGLGNLLAKGLFSALKGLKAAGGAVGNALVDLNPFKGLVDKIGKGVGESPFAQMIGGGAKNLVNKAIDWMTEKMPFGGDTGSINDPGGQGAGVGRWSDIVKQALTLLNQPTSAGMVNTVLRRMKQESGGNPKAINNTDSNARRGTPSKGLMQVIGPTFNAYAMKGFTSNIYDPLSNILASMRYAIATYGSLGAAYNKKGGYKKGGTIAGYALGGSIMDGNGLSMLSGMMAPTKYDDGGYLPPGLTTVLNATGKPEPVFTHEQFSMMNGSSSARWNIESVTVADPDEFVRAVDARERKRELLYPF